MQKFIHYVQEKITDEMLISGTEDKVMLYNVSFMCNGIGCSNLVETNADIETAEEYFIQEKLNGDRSQFIGISKNNEAYKPGKPIHKMPNNWKPER
jgi:hypothetical protein